MGGEWGVGAALAFETLPAEGRGFFSGVLQEGYVVGYLMAALVYGTLFHFIGWRGLFVVGALPAFLVIYIRSKVDESSGMEGRDVCTNQPRAVGQRHLERIGMFVLMVVLMFAFNSFSHGAQICIRRFCKKEHHFAPQTVMVDCRDCQCGSAVGRDFFWNVVGKDRTAEGDRDCRAAFASGDTVVGLFAYHSDAGRGGISDAIHGARGVGSDSGAFESNCHRQGCEERCLGLHTRLGTFWQRRNSVIYRRRLAEQRLVAIFAPVLAWTVLLTTGLVALVTWSGSERRGADMSKTN